jgi:hypothetical protein
MSLSSVWLRTQGDGLVRADQVVGIDAHQTPALTGKPARWLLDIVLEASVGSGQRGDWGLDVLHRTLAQTPQPPGDAPAVLARLLAQLDAMNAAGIVTVARRDRQDRDSADDGLQAETSVLRFRFEPFAGPPPGPRAEPEGEYL